MNTNWDAAFEMLIKSEGGYVNDPHDNGGETNLGVTKAAWAEHLGRPVADGEMKALTKDVVKPFYKRQYWDKCKCDELPSGVDYAVFDFAVNAGAGQSAKLLQRALGVTDDGIIGVGTLRMVSKVDGTKLLEAFGDSKERFYKSIVEKHPEQGKFLKGWLNRIEHVEPAAQTMLA